MMNILAATDLSARSARALGRALRLADSLPARLTVLHVVDDELPDHIAAQLLAGARELIGASLQTTPATVAPEVLVAKGEDWRMIAGEALAGHCDLIVLGPHRMTVKGFLHGCTMERVVRTAQRPVLVVRDEAQTDYQNVIAAVDFSVASRYAVEAALRFAPNANLTLVHAYQIPLFAHIASQNTREEMQHERNLQFSRMIEEEMAAFLTSINRAPESINRVMTQGDTLAVIEAEVEARKADLLVLGTRGRTGTAVNLLGSIALAFLEFPPCDVLVAQSW